MNSPSIHTEHLPLGTHRFQMALDNKFLTKYWDEDMLQGNFDVTIVLHKCERLIRAEFNIQGKIVLVCDRSLDQYDYSIEIKKELFFNYGDRYEELSNEIIMINRKRPVLEVAQLIYEFIELSIPMKKLHPRFVDDNESEQFIYSS